MSCRVLKSKDYKITYGYKSSHQAVDIIGSDGGLDTIVAHSEGVVEWCQSGIPNAQGSSGNRSYGNAVKIRHPNGYKTLYAHMSSIYVSTGQSVSKGQNLGYMGNTGNSYGSHLHFEVRLANDSRVSPTTYLSSSLPNMSEATGGTSTATNVSIEEVRVLGETSTVQEKEGGYVRQISVNSSSYEILIESGLNVYMPVVLDSVKLDFTRQQAPTALSFTCLLDSELKHERGNAVSFRYKGENIFYGYIFSITQTNSSTVNILCYDQLRYFKNKTAYSYSNKKYSDLLKEVSGFYTLKLGEIEDTSHLIGRRLEQCSIFEMLSNASDETFSKTGKLFILYDDYGKICLKDMFNMVVPILLSEDTVGSFSYTSDIDSNTYTKISLSRNNHDTGYRELFLQHNEEAQKKWGVLELNETANELSDLEIKNMLDTLINTYGKETSSLTINKCLGDIRVRGGVLVVVELNLENKKERVLMRVEKAEHVFKQGIHYMNLQLVNI